MTLFHIRGLPPCLPGVPASPAQRPCTQLEPFLPTLSLCSCHSLQSSQIPFPSFCDPREIFYMGIQDFSQREDVMTSLFCSIHLGFHSKGQSKQHISLGGRWINNSHTCPGLWSSAASPRLPNLSIWDQDTSQRSSPFAEEVRSLGLICHCRPFAAT